MKKKVIEKSFHFSSIYKYQMKQSTTFLYPLKTSTTNSELKLEQETTDNFLQKTTNSL